jgi:predicted transcriptional regulator
MDWTLFNTIRRIEKEEKRDLVELALAAKNMSDELVRSASNNEDGGLTVLDRAVDVMICSFVAALRANPDLTLRQMSDIFIDKLRRMGDANG